LCGIRLRVAPKKADIQVLGLHRSFRHLSVRSSVAVVLALFSTAALAQERLVMPYACSAYGGRVTLSPSREEAYRIYGQREERPYTVCSPINPNACRTWLLHRFELDCGGTRVDWLSVIEAASEQTTGRAWVEDGRLHMRMNQYWGGRGIGPDDDPYPRWRRKGPYGDDFADRGVRRRGAVIEMPPGFAPAFGLPVRFVPADLPATPVDPRAGAELPGKGGPPKSARIEREMPGPLVKDLPPREPVAKEPIAKDPSAKTPQVAGSVTTAPSNVPKSEPIVRPAAKSTEPPAEVLAPVQVKPKAPEKAPEPAREVAAADPATSTGTVTVVPKIINRPSGAEPSAVGQSAPAKPATPVTEKAPDPVLPRVAEVKPKIDAAPAAKPSIPFDVSPGPSTLTAVAPSSTMQALVGFAALVALALGLFVWARRREQLSLAGAGAREFGSVNFGGRTVWAKAGTALGRPRRPAAAAAPRLPVETHTTAFGDGQVPRTREEACRVLGTSPDASEAAIKKIVEGLRQSWHPDLATSETDRRLREQRTTQINVAWDILSGKRATG
jgi:hypothetical protein